MLNSKSAARSWLYSGMFVCALGGVVAFTALSGRPEPTGTKEEAPAAQPVKEIPLALTGAKTQGVQWSPSFEEAMQKARAEKKPILIDFYTDWCSACKLFNKNVLPKKDVIAESSNWVAVHINAEKRQDVAQAYGVTGYPTFVFAENTGKPITVLPGYAPDIDFAKLMRDTREKWEKGIS